MKTKGAILYFSLTGNTLLACEYIAGKIPNASFDFFNMREGYPDLSGYDLIGVATYADGFTIAPFVKDYLSKLPHTEKPAFAFNTFGDNNAATTKTLADFMAISGLRVVAGHALHTPENHPPTIYREHGYISHPDANDMAGFRDFIAALETICAKIQAGEQMPVATFPVKWMYRHMPNVTNPKFIQLYVGRLYVDSDKCNSCGKCAKGCAYGAITMDVFPVFEPEKCRGCFSCYNRCPQAAIYTKKSREKGFVRYPGPNRWMKEKLTIKPNDLQEENGR